MSPVDTNIYKLIYNFVMFSSYTIALHTVLTPKYTWKSGMSFVTLNIIWILICSLLPENTFALRNVTFLIIQLVCCFTLYKDTPSWTLFAAAILLVSIYMPECYLILFFYIMNLDLTKVIDEYPFIGTFLYSGLFFILGSVKMLKTLTWSTRIPRSLMISIAIFLFANLTLPIQCILFKESGMIIALFFLFDIFSISLMLYALHQAYQKNLLEKNRTMQYKTYVNVLSQYQNIEVEKEGKLAQIRHELNNDLQTIAILKQQQYTQQEKEGNIC